jgi:hypothetical protein
LYNYVFSQRTKEYWSKKHNIKAELITNINWDACQLRETSYGLEKGTGTSSMQPGSAALEKWKK